MTVAPRFISQGGSLSIDRRPATLAEGLTLARAWFSAGLTEQRLGNWRVANELKRQAEALERACRECADWRRCAGWSDPLLADRPTTSRGDAA